MTDIGSIISRQIAQNGKAFARRAGASGFRSGLLVRAAKVSKDGGDRRSHPMVFTTYAQATRPIATRSGKTPHFGRDRPQGRPLRNSKRAQAGAFDTSVPRSPETACCAIGADVTRGTLAHAWSRSVGSPAARYRLRSK